MIHKTFEGEKDFMRTNWHYKNCKDIFDRSPVADENKALVYEFLESCRLGLYQKKIGKNRIVRTFLSLRHLCNMLPSDKIWHDLTKSDIRAMLIKVEEHPGWGEWEKYVNLTILRKFMSWLRSEYSYPTNYPDRERLIALLPLLDHAPEVKINLTRPNKLKPLNEIPTAEEVGYLLAACDLLTDRLQGARNKAFLSVLFELGARIGGIGPLKIRDIVFDDIGALISITDKTMRGESVRVIQSVPALKAWLYLHPLKNDPDAPLWVKLRGDSKLEQIDYGTARKILHSTVKLHNKTAASRGLPKIERRIHFHAFRYFAQGRDALAGMPIAVMCKQRGWSPTSKQPQRYARISNEQVDAWLVKHYNAPVMA